MSKKFQNNAKHNISAIFQGKKIIIKPGQVVSGPDEFLQYNGLHEVSKKAKYDLDKQMSVLEINKLEVENTINLVNSIDTSKPYSNYKKSDIKKTFSIITLTNVKSTYINFLNTLINQETNFTFELIPLFNYQNEFKSCSKALNFGMTLANSDYYILCHHDLTCPNYWIQKFKEYFDLLEKQPVNLGFIGMAGTSKLGKSPQSEYGALYLSNSASKFVGKEISFANMMRGNYGSFKEVQCLDECVMACKSNLGITFDDVNFDYYHFYGADICLYAISKGYKNFAVDVDCYHLSDGQQNLVNEKHQKSFIEHGSRLFKKWRDKIPYFRTTTSSFYGPEKIWSPLIFNDVNRKYGTKVPLEIRVM